MEYQIVGSSMQAVHFTLAPGEKIYADSGKLVSKSSSIKMTPRLAGGLVKAIERKVTGASALLTEFEAEGTPGSVTIAGIIPGKVYHVALNPGEQLVAEDFAFIAADESVQFSIATVGIGPAFFGGAGLVLQKLDGPGNVFLHVAGDIVEYMVDEANPLEIDPGHIAAFDSTLKYKITFVDNIRTAMFGGVGLFLAKFEGRGKVIAHSVSRYKLASELYLDGLRQNKK